MEVGNIIADALAWIFVLAVAALIAVGIVALFIIALVFGLILLPLVGASWVFSWVYSFIQGRWSL